MDEIEAIKATVIDGDIPGGGSPTSQSIPDETEDPWEGRYGTRFIQPPLNPLQLCRAVERSNILPQCIDVMCQNVEGFGHILIEQPWLAQLPQAKKPHEAVEEHARLRKFLRQVNPEMSLVEIRRRLRRDLETTGNAFLEVLRDGKGEIAGLVHIPAHTVRLTVVDREWTEIEWPVLHEEGEYELIPHKKRFRRYAQLVGMRKTFWKEFWDPRPISSTSGKVTTADDPAQANEMIHLRLYAAGSAYGSPRWAGTLLAALGSRAAEEVNYLYFDNKSIPPMAFLISGGELTSKTRKQLERFIQDQIKGRENFHKCLIIEAKGTDDPAGLDAGRQVKIEMKPLTDLIQKDALFMRYDQGNREKVRSAFRLPPLYVGLAQDYNRATAEEARDVAEGQVFGPEREQFDWIMNQLILADLRVKAWRFESLAARQQNPDNETQILKTFLESLTNREVRTFAERILHVDLEEPGEHEDGHITQWDWLDQPMKVYLAKLQLQQAEAQAQGASAGEIAETNAQISKAVEIVQSLAALRARLEADAEE